MSFYLWIGTLFIYVNFSEPNSVLRVSRDLAHPLLQSLGRAFHSFRDIESELVIVDTTLLQRL